MGWLFIIIGIGLLGAVVWWCRHQHKLRERAWLMREALRNHDYSFRLPTKGLPSGERAMQQLLNDLGQEIRRLMAQQEVESWQRLTRVLTHEIMNATAPISSITQSFLNRPDVKGTPLEDGIRAICETSAGLTSFVESYRKFMQFQKAEPTDTPLLEVVASVQSLYTSLRWSIDIPADQKVYADSHLLRQVLTNLVKNAQEAGATQISLQWRTEDGTSGARTPGTFEPSRTGTFEPLSTGVFEPSRTGLLAVSNDGAPIPADIRREIFVPFFTTKRRGSGIGLALSRQMMVMQGGDLTLNDTHQHGCHVTFLLRMQLL